MTPASLFIRLYLDEDVSILLAELLRPRGFDVLTSRDAHTLGQSDAAQLSFASAQQRALLTHNRADFEALHLAALRDSRPHSGIIIANRRHSDMGLARRVMNLLNTFTADEITNQLLYL